MGNLVQLRPTHAGPPRGSMPGRYLDEQPELQSVVRDWLGCLVSRAARWIAFDTPRLEEIECRSRDGFIRASHNFGGFDLEWISDVDACNGSGSGPNLPEIDRQVDQAYAEARTWFREQGFEGMEHLTEDQINYHYLHEIGRGDLAEQLDATEREWMNSPVRWGVRAMYEGRDAKTGVHTLMVYVGGNVCEYHGAHGRGSVSLATHTVTFKTASGLRRQLTRLKSKVESSL